LKAESRRQSLPRPTTAQIPCEFEMGSLELSEFHVAAHVESSPLVDSTLEESEMKALFLALAQAEETTLRDILDDFRHWLSVKGTCDLGEYKFTRGLAEYYVLSEIECFDPTILKEPTGQIDLEISTRQGVFVIKKARCFRYTLRSPDGSVQTAN